MPTVTEGGQGAFTYDFGIAIAQGTVNKLARLAGVSLTLAAAYNSLMTFAKEYVVTLKQQATYFGGYAKSLDAVALAQKNLMQGTTTFSVDDQISGMRQMMAMGVDVKNNFDYINKSAHAMGRSFSEFSSAIAQGIQGNMGGLVEMGLITQRATRMFEKYQGNTIMRQQAILNFIKNHKALQEMIKNDFYTIQDQMTRLSGVWKAFLRSVTGDPRDPNSFYGQVVGSLKNLADGLGRNIKYLERAGYALGRILGWVVKQVFDFVNFVGKQVIKTLRTVDYFTDDYKQKTLDTILWLEFWKVKIVSFFKEYGKEIKTVLKLLILYKAVKTAFVIGSAAMASIKAYTKAVKGLLLLQSRYRTSMGASWLMSLNAFLPRWLRRITIAFAKFAANMGIVLKALFTRGFGAFFSALRVYFPLVGKIITIIKAIPTGLTKAFHFMARGARFLLGVLRNIPAIMGTILKLGKVIIGFFLGSNPVGWVITVIGLFVVLYTKVKAYRNAIDSMVQMVVAGIRFIWNLIVFIYVKIRVGLIKTGQFFKKYLIDPISVFFSSMGGWISEMWNKFKDSSVGKWLGKYIVNPIKEVLKALSNAWDTLAKVYQWFKNLFDKGSKSLNMSTQKDAEQYGISAPVWSVPTTPNQTSATPQIAGTTPTSTTTTGNVLTPNPDLVETVTKANTTTMNVAKGAIQINIDKGSNIDEDKLTRKIMEALQSLQRTSNVRAGTV